MPEFFSESDFSWFFNFEVPRQANLSAEQFLRKLSHIQALRCRATYQVSWYITSSEEWAAWDVIHSVANEKRFHGIECVTDHDHVFGLFIPASLASYLQQRSLDTLKDEIVNAQRWLFQTGGYDFHTDITFARQLTEEGFQGVKGPTQDVMEKQIWAPIRANVCATTPKCAPIESPEPEIVGAFRNWRTRALELTDLSTPRNYDLRLYVAYLRRDDWDHIFVHKRYDDPLLRADSDHEVWERWKYDLFRNRVLKKQIKGSNVPPAVRFEILRRDNYTCQICGATVGDGTTLEVDHRIAKAAGGDNSRDNLWTLCSTCNRGKGKSPLD